MALTNKEIAKQLNVSASTLSFIINNKPGIAESTRSRVIEEIHALGYGHILKKETSPQAGNICFVPYKRHGTILNQSAFYLLLMEQIEERARSAGFNLLVRIIDKSGPVEEQIRALNASDISGLILFATEMFDDDMEPFKKTAMPVVALDNDFTHLETDSVVINNRVGTFKAIEHLAANGHRKIGYLKSRTFINSFGERDEGYRNALRHFGLGLDPAHTHPLGFTEEESYQDFKKILAGGADLPTAFVTDDDLIAVGVMRALTEFGVAVPDRVALVGFDDRPVCRLTRPQLSSVAVPKGWFGSLAVDLLAERIAAPPGECPDYRKIEVGVQLVARESTCMAGGQVAAME